MVEKICDTLVKLIRSKMPEIDDEKAEIILYGIQLIIGEIPKMIILFVLSFILGIGWYTIIAFVALIPYRTVSGGFHLKTHLGCILGTSIFYYGNVYISKFFVFDNVQKYILILISFFIGLVMVSLYAPADTENVPILSKKERKKKKILSYIMLSATLLASLFIQDTIISNILIFGVIIQSIMISKFAYRLTKNKYGYEVYKEETVNI